MRSSTRNRVVRAIALTAVTIAGIGVTLTPAHAAAAPVDFYVSPSGNDANAGTSTSAPFKTLQAAQTAVRAVDKAAAGRVTVHLAGGTYRLTSPLTFTAADSTTGANGDIWWEAESGTQPVISGGVKITGWTLHDASKNIWQAPAPASLTTRQLYVNGVRATRATGAIPVTLTRTSTGFSSTGDPMAGYANQSAMEFVFRGGIGKWTEPRCPIASITATAIVMQQPCWNNITKRVVRTDGSGQTANLASPPSINQPPTSVENAYELLNAPGEWYLNASTHVVYYIPRSGETMSSADVEAPALQTLLRTDGNPSAEAHTIGFQGIQFEYASYTVPDTGTGYADLQATYTISGTTGYATQGLCTYVSGGTCPYGNWTKMPAAVDLSYDASIHFDHDSFVHLGAAGLDLGDGSRSDVVSGCVFTDISGNGLDIGGVDIPEPTANQAASGESAKDNHFTNIGAEYQDAVAIDVGYAQTSTFSHNQIDHVPYTGISIGWGGWPDKVNLPAEPNASNHNVISDNLIFDHMSVLGDGGGIYTNGITGTSMATGEQITGNVIHDQINPPGPGIYIDNGGAYVTVSGNAEYNLPSVWGKVHPNTTLNNGTNDPLAITGNYWTQSWPDSNALGVLIQGNHTITGASQIPSAITAVAGLEAAYQPILTWAPAP